MVKNFGFGVLMGLGLSPTRHLLVFLTLGKLLNLLNSQFPHLPNSNKGST